MFKNSDKVTRNSSHNNIRSVIDLTLIDSKYSNMITDFEITNETCNSDHNSIIITINRQKAKNIPKIIHKLDSDKYKKKLELLDIEKLGSLEDFEHLHRKICEDCFFSIDRTGYKNFIPIIFGQKN